MSKSSKVALITGSSRGIGRAIALRLARDGYTVAVNHRADAAGADSVLEEIHASGGTAAGFQADVGDAAQAVQLVGNVVDRFGRLDAAICNAAIAPYVPFNETTLEIWDRTHSVNLRGTFLVAQAAANAMIAAESGGRLVAISSISAIVGGQFQVAYTPTKAGQVSLMRSLAVALGRHGITANSVEPGTILTSLNEEILKDPKTLAHYEGRIPLGRIGRPEDVAGAVAFLLSEDAAYITGTEILVDGGALVNFA